MFPFQLFQPRYMLEVACQKELAVTFLRRTPTMSFQRGFLRQLEKLSISAVSPASGSQRREVFRQRHFLGALILLVCEFCSISAQIQAGDHLNFPFIFLFFSPSLYNRSIGIGPNSNFSRRSKAGFCGAAGALEAMAHRACDRRGWPYAGLLPSPSWISLQVL